MITNTLINTTSTLLFSSIGENAVTTIFFCNTSDVSDASVDVYVVPAAGVVGTSTQVMNALVLPATETFVFDAEKLILENGAAVWAKSNTVLQVAATISSVQVS